MPAVALGGLGGGGDVGLALMLAASTGLSLEDIVVLSFLNCSASSSYVERIRVEGSLIEIPQNYFWSRRVFEDKIPLVFPSLAGRIYAVCTRDSWPSLVAGIEYLVELYKPRCIIGADIGGDALVLGYEPSMGSYKTDSIARALLAHIAEKGLAKTVVATAAISAEGGGGELDTGWVATSLLYHEEHDALLGVTTPREDVVVIGYELLRYAESGMLPLYLASVLGREKVAINQAYLHGVYRVEPWYKYVFVVDAARSCSISPLCQAARNRGILGLKNYTRKQVPPRLEKLYREVTRELPSRVVNQVIERNRVDKIASILCYDASS